MNYQLLKEIIDLCEDFETKNQGIYTMNADGFQQWITAKKIVSDLTENINWEGKEKGRSIESVINTLVVHMNRYAKSYSKAVILNTGFSSQDDFIYLINLKAFGEMTKMDLIKRNMQEKSVGIQVINRLIQNGWVKQEDSSTDKRSKVLLITSDGLKALEESMPDIRKATKIVTGNLSEDEKIQLIYLLQKLEDFHEPIYLKNIEPEKLLDEALALRMQ